MPVNVDTGKAALVIVLTILGVVLINLVIYAMVRGKGTTGQIDMMRKAAKRARNPWIVEDTALKDLSELVKQFKQDQTTPSQKSEQESQDNQGDKT